MNVVEPSEAQLNQFLQDIKNESYPVVMVNLLKFRKEAIYTDHPEMEKCSGYEAYQRYLDCALPIVESLGGRVVFLGSVNSMLIGPESEDWDEVILVEYPNKAAFLEMGMSDKYRQGYYHRTAGLQNTRLWVTQQIPA